MASDSRAYKCFTNVEVCKSFGFQKFQHNQENFHDRNQKMQELHSFQR